MDLRSPNSVALLYGPRQESPYDRYIKQFTTLDLPFINSPSPFSTERWIWS
jgi:hypothetical protein